jgi:hypothetical protein
MSNEKDYGDLMQFLLYFREQYSDDEEFNRFVMQTLRAFVYDLRDLGVYISISPHSLNWPASRLTASTAAKDVTPLPT